jgi:uncharacterized protein (TIGR00725 family)
VTGVRSRAVAVVGPGDASGETAAAARAVGSGLAAAGLVVVTGGGAGVMAAAAQGALAAGGLTVAFLPGIDPAAAHPYARVVVPTGMGEARNVLVVRAADAVVAVGGSWGTLAEVALARRTGVPVVGLRTWTPRDADGEPVPDAPVPATDPTHAVRLVLAAIGET